MSPEARKEIREYLLRGDYGEIAKLASSNKGVLGHLISLTYDKADIICWRAIEAVGRLSGGMRMSQAKDALERVLTMMRDESGGNPWSGPELLGEIILNNADRFEHYISILASFHEEEIFTAGILRALSRLAGPAYKEVLPYRELAFIYLHHKDPSIKGNALLVLKALKDDTYAASIRELLPDKAEFVFYNGGHLVKKTIGETAEETLRAVNSQKF